MGLDHIDIVGSETRERFFHACRHSFR
jgi:hypothetical protein